MADDVAITAGSGTSIAADERTINAVAVKVQRVTDQGGTAFATAQTSISSTAATLIAARETRKMVTIVNRQVEPVFIGPATVTSSNGVRLDPGDSVTIYTTALIQGITSAATGGGAIHTVEVYDS